MTIQIANAIVQRLGPCRFVIDRKAHDDTANELALLGCAVADLPTAPAPKKGRGATAGYLAWTAPRDWNGFSRVLSRFAHVDALALHSVGQEREPMENALFRAGWRRHPGGMLGHEYPEFSSWSLPELSFYQRATRDDGLLREGAEADAIIARFAQAANHVRPGDHVVIDGMNAEDGVAIVTALTRFGEVSRTGEDGRAGKGGGVIASDLSTLADHSVDLVIAFEPASPKGWVARIDDYLRVLKFDGRLVLGWYRDDGDGSRPQDWDDLTGEVAQRFLPEKRYVDEALGAGPSGPHHLMPIDVETQGDSDWLMIVASYNPLMGEGQADRYEHPAYPVVKGRPPALVDFGAAYDNPWLYRSLVQMGERLLDDTKLGTLAECIIEDAREDSADRGAALAVLGYRILEMRRADIAAVILPLVEGYAALPLLDETPVHVRRWRLSLAFLAGRLHELAGDRVAAKRFYRSAAEGDWEAFSPLLATKAIAGAFYEARLHLADGDMQAALACFRQGADIAFRAAAFPHDTQMDADGQPLGFYLQELAEVIDMGSQCANALSNIHLWDRDPGLFWRQVDTRRFGLASWARDLERENNRLRGVA